MYVSNVCINNFIPAPVPAPAIDQLKLGINRNFRGNKFV